ncbi:MAG: carboxypeptidase-like regulatory domain-containing protein [Microlunatus sp.]
MNIQGVVTDPSGQPVPGAVVMLAAAPVPVPDIAALTDDEGRFSIVVPVSGAYRLLVRGAVDLVEISVAVHETSVEVSAELSS